MPGTYRARHFQPKAPRRSRMSGQKRLPNHEVEQAPSMDDDKVAHPKKSNNGWRNLMAAVVTCLTLSMCMPCKPARSHRRRRSKAKAWWRSHRIRTSRNNVIARRPHVEMNVDGSSTEKLGKVDDAVEQIQTVQNEMAENLTGEEESPKEDNGTSSAVLQTAPTNELLDQERSPSEQENRPTMKLPLDHNGRNPSMILDPLRSNEASLAKLPKLLGRTTDSSEIDLYRKNERLEKELMKVTLNLASSVLSEVFSFGATFERDFEKVEKRKNKTVITECDLLDLFENEKQLLKTEILSPALNLASSKQLGTTAAPLVMTVEAQMHSEAGLLPPKSPMACSGQDLSTETPNKNSVKMQQDEVFVNAEKVDSKDTLKVQGNTKNSAPGELAQGNLKLGGELPGNDPNTSDDSKDHSMLVTAIASPVLAQPTTAENVIGKDLPQPCAAIDSDTGLLRLSAAKIDLGKVLTENEPVSHSVDLLQIAKSGYIVEDKLLAVKSTTQDRSIISKLNSSKEVEGRDTVSPPVPSAESHSDTSQQLKMTSEEKLDTSTTMPEGNGFLEVLTNVASSPPGKIPKEIMVKPCANAFLDRPTLQQKELMDFSKLDSKGILNVQNCSTSYPTDLGKFAQENLKTDKELPSRDATTPRTSIGSTGSPRTTRTENVSGKILAKTGSLNAAADFLQIAIPGNASEDKLHALLKSTAPDQSCIGKLDSSNEAKGCDAVIASVPSAESRFNELRDRAQIKMALDQKLARSVIYRNRSYSDSCDEMDILSSNRDSEDKSSFVKSVTATLERNRHGFSEVITKPVGPSPPKSPRENTVRPRANKIAYRPALQQEKKNISELDSKVQSNSMNDTAIGKFAQDNSGTENELPAMDSTKNLTGTKSNVLLQIVGSKNRSMQKLDRSTVPRTRSYSDSCENVEQVESGKDFHRNLPPGNSTSPRTASKSVGLPARPATAENTLKGKFQAKDYSSTDKLDSSRGVKDCDNVFQSVPSADNRSNELRDRKQVKMSVEPKLIRSVFSRNRSYSDSWDRTELLNMDRDLKDGLPSVKSATGTLARNQSGFSDVITRPTSPSPPKAAKVNTARPRANKLAHSTTLQQKKAWDCSDLKESPEDQNDSTRHAPSHGKFQSRNNKRENELPAMESTTNFTATKSNVLLQIIGSKNRSMQKLDKSKMPRTRSYSDSCDNFELLKTGKDFRSKFLSVNSTSNVTAHNSPNSAAERLREELPQVSTTLTGSSTSSNSLEKFKPKSAPKKKLLIAVGSKKQTDSSDKSNVSKAELISVDQFSLAKSTKANVVGKSSTQVKDYEIDPSDENVRMDEMVKAIMSNDTPYKKIRSRSRLTPSTRKTPNTTQEKPTQGLPKIDSDNVLHPDSGWKSPPSLLTAYEQASSFHEREVPELTIPPDLNVKENFFEPEQDEKSVGCFSVFRGIWKRNEKNFLKLQNTQNVAGLGAKSKPRRDKFMIVADRKMVGNGDKSVIRDKGQMQFKIRAQVVEKLQSLEQEFQKFESDKQLIKQTQKEGEIWYKEKKVELKVQKKNIINGITLLKGSERKRWQENERKKLKKDKEILLTMARDEKKWNKAKLIEIKESLKEIKKKQRKVKKEVQSYNRDALKAQCGATT